MRTVTLNTFGTYPESTPIAYNLTLKTNQVYRLPEMFPHVRVIAGSAWITYQGKDIILSKGERCGLCPSICRKDIIHPLAANASVSGPKMGHLGLW